MPCLGLLLLTHHASANTGLARLKGVYQKSLDDISADHTHALNKIHEEYREGLELLSDNYREAGELEIVLAIREEQKRYDDDTRIPKPPPKQTGRSAIERFQSTLHEKLVTATEYRDHAIIDLTEKYISHLERLKRQHTVEDKIENALEIKAEIDRVRQTAQYTAAEFAIAARQTANNDTPTDTDTSVPTSQNITAPADSCTISWNGLRSGSRVTVSRNGTSVFQRLRHEGGNRLPGATIVCSGGRTFVGVSNAALVDACKRSQTLALAATFETEDLKQSGPARILGISLDGHNRNVSLCQERDTLMLRLRTTETGHNGTSPEVSLCKVKANTRTKILITYRPGNLRCYLNGKEISVRQINGDLSTWTDYPIVLGNEAKVERQWRGRIHAFMFSSRLPRD